MQIAKIFYKKSKILIISKIFYNLCMISISTFSKISKFSLFIGLLGLGIFLKSLSLITLGITFLFLVLTEKYLKIRIPNSFSWIFVIFIILSVILGSYGNFYEKFTWWDDMLHFSYGIGFAYLGFLIIFYINLLTKSSQNTFLLIMFSFCFSVAFGAIWEIYEYAIDVFFGTNMQRTLEYGIHDTMHDIILETVATLVTNFYIFVYLTGKERNWIGKLTEKFVKINAKK